MHSHTLFLSTVLVIREFFDHFSDRKSQSVCDFLQRRGSIACSSSEGRAFVAIAYVSGHVSVPVTVPVTVPTRGGSGLLDNGSSLQCSAEGVILLH